jgi:nucleoside-diphosphate-sugar epimerase
MNKAIVLGATGYVGAAVVKKLLANNISVLAIGRKTLNSAREVLPLESDKIDYLQLDSSNILQLLEFDDWQKWTTQGKTAFYNFSWSGVERLTDGDMPDQFKNIAFASDAVKAAKKLGCIKYINIGSQEESLFDYYLKNSWQNESYNIDAINYSGAKLVTRDMSMLIAYLEKIDYIHTRFSVVIDSNLFGSGYVSKSIKALKNDKSIAPVQNKQLFEIIDLDELSDAYIAIGLYGKNKSDYYIGANYPMLLSEYFSLFLDCKNNKNIDYKTKVKKLGCFDSSALFKDTGFKIEKEFHQLSIEILNK